MRAHKTFPGRALALPSVHESVPTPKEGPLSARTPGRAADAMERRRAHAATSRSRRGEPAQHTQRTHTRTHALEIALDQEEAARDPGVANKWASVLSRSGERRKKEKEEEEKRARTGPTSPTMRRAQEDFRPEDAIPFSFFFLHGNDTRVPPVGETR